MFPPPPVSPKGDGGTSVLHGNDWKAVVSFYDKVFGAWDITRETLDDVEYPTVRFGDALIIRKMSPATANAEVILYAASPEHVQAVVSAFASDDELHETAARLFEDDERVYTQLVDPDQNVVWILAART